MGQHEMTERIRRLREESQAARPEISDERARLLTDFLESPEAAGKPPALLRGLFFRHLMRHKALWLGEGELIVGERGPAPRQTPTYPEICCHSLEDLRILRERPKVHFYSSPEVEATYRDRMIPFWQGRTQREQIMNHMTPEWLSAYRAGIFTEFQEQRAPGHTVGDDKIFRLGFGNLIERIDRQLASLSETDPDYLDRSWTLQGMRAAAEGLILLGRRYARLLIEKARQTEDPDRRAELTRMAAICRRVPARAPRTFHEALQMYWFVHLGVVSEFNTWDSFNPGRLDQHLYPFFSRDLEAGRESEDSLRELLMAFWIKFNNQPAPPKVGVTAQESNTYTDFCLINIGGVRPDGQDGSNELSFMLLDTIQTLRILQPSSMVQISRKTPDALLMRALKVIRTGFGQPSLFNTDAIVGELLRQGKSLEDARQGGASGCVEAGAFGKEAYFLSGYFNLVKILELTLYGGRDPQSGEQLGPEDTRAGKWTSFDELMDSFAAQVEHFVRIKIRGNQVIEGLYARLMPAPFLSLLIDDCIARGRDYHSGGARYNTTYIQGVGMGTITDSLSAIRTHVFDQKRLTFRELVDHLESNFTRDPAIRSLLADQTPRYGNDDDRADELAQKVFGIFWKAVDGVPNPRGGTHRVNLLPTTVHVYFGSRRWCFPPPNWIRERPGEPCSTRSSARNCWRMMPPWPRWGIWCGPILPWMATTSSSTWWMPRP